MSSASDSLLAAVAIASVDAAARIQAAESASKNQATAEVQAAGLRAEADVSAAEAHASGTRDAAQMQSQAMVQAASIDASWHSAVASIDSAWHAQVAGIEAGWQESVAGIHAGGVVAAAQAEASGRIAVAGIDAGWREGVAATEAQGQVSAAEAHAQGSIGAAQASASGQVSAATAQADATKQAAVTDANARVQSAQTQANATVQVASIDAGWHAGVATTEAGAVKYRADQELVGVKYSADSETSRLNLKLAFANDKFDTLLPIIENAVGYVLGTGTGTGGGTGGGIGFHAMGTPGPTMGFGGVLNASSELGSAGDYYQMGTYSRRVLSAGEIHMGGGDVKSGGIGFATAGTSVADAVAGTQLPLINTSGVLTPAQIQQQVNAAYARNDAKTTSETLRLVEDLAGKGFSANSPILSALRVGLTGQNLRSSILAEQQIRLEGAKANAELILASQKALSDQFIAQEGVLVDKDKNDVTRTVGIISAVMQMIGSAL